MITMYAQIENKFSTQTSNFGLVIVIEILQIHSNIPF